MKLFKQFMDQNRRKFVCLDLSATSSIMLRNWCAANGFDVTTSYSGKAIKPSQFDFHVTVFYSDNFSDLTTGKETISPFELPIIGFEFLGEDQNIPVLLIDPECAQLAAIRARYENAGLTDKWPTYKPHVSVSYNYSGDKSMPPLPEFALIANRLKVENIS